MPLAFIMIANLGWLSPLVQLLFVVGAAYLIWWGFNRIKLPEPIGTILLVVIGLFLLFALYQILIPMLGMAGG